MLVVNPDVDRLARTIALLLGDWWTVDKRTLAPTDREQHMITETEVDDFPDEEHLSEELQALRATIGDCLQRIRTIEGTYAGKPAELNAVITGWVAVVEEKLFDSDGDFFGGGTPVVQGPDQLVHTTRSLLESGWAWMIRMLKGPADQA